MLGIGLGGFVDGLNTGAQLRQQFDTTRDKRRLKKLDQQATADFEQKVESGEQKGDNFLNFYKQYWLPRREMEMLRQGDVKGAADLRKWAESSGAEKGASLFSQALLKAQMGDSDGALNLGLEAAQTKGYIDPDFELVGNQPVMDREGNMLGHRITYRDKKGKEYTQDVTPDQIPEVIATFASPDAAWQSRQEAAKSRTKKAETEKKEAEKTDRDLRNKALKHLRETMDGGLGGDEPRFDDLPRDEQERLIAEDLALRRGDRGEGVSAASPKKPQRDIIVDRADGSRVAAQPEKGTPPGLGEVAAPAAGPGSTTPAEAPGLGQTAAASSNKRPAPEAPREEPSAANTVAIQAEHMVMFGRDPNEAAALLRKNGVPEGRWPESVRAALQSNNQKSPGLGF